MKLEWIPTALIAIAIVSTASILGSSWSDTRERHEKISVTGLAQRDFTSDVIVWRGSYERKAMVLSQAYALIKNDADVIRRYLQERSVDAKEIVFGAVEINKSFRDVPVGDNIVREFDGYLLTQSVKIESRNVDHIESVGRQISELLNMGVELQSQVPLYYYSKLNELKIDLLAKASADGRLRAETIAENSGSTLGKLYRSDMGTFQITAPNSDEQYTWGGAFNTTSRRKTASVTVRMDFLVK